MSNKDISEDGWKNIRFGDIELGERIGGGGVGVIYKGNNQNLVLSSNLQITVYGINMTI